MNLKAPGFAPRARRGWPWATLRAIAAVALGFALGCGPSRRAQPTILLAEARAIVTRAENELVAGRYCAFHSSPAAPADIIRPAATAGDDGRDEEKGHGAMPSAFVHADESTPRDLRDAARAVLRGDRIDQFGPAIEFLDSLPDAADDDSFQARALSAQLRLSWAEAELITAEVLDVATRYIDSEIGRIAAERALGAERVRRRARVRQVRAAIAEARYIARGFQRIGEERMREARALIEGLANDAPDHYLSYRLRADVYRIDRDWPRFDEAIEGLTERRPTATGLKFLLGAAGVRRGESDALRYLDAALDDEPEFARAQVFRVLAVTERADVVRELDALARISPHHQLIEWVAPLLVRGQALDE